MNNQTYANTEPPIAAEHPTEQPSQQGTSRKILIWVTVAVVIIFILIIAGIIWLATVPAETTARVRDIFIIFMALESLLIGAVLIILTWQVARLINLLQNEIKPILDSTQETVSTLRGTTTFLSENMVQPVIKMNEYLAGLTQVFRLVGLARKRPPKE